jgi:aryl-alcohol dehydrogenase-like predicted oxidoreductase
MEHRPLGHTGVSVSKLCLGAMMFGDWGTKDHDEHPDQAPLSGCHAKSCSPYPSH